MKKNIYVVIWLLGFVSFGLPVLCEPYDNDSESLKEIVSFLIGDADAQAVETSSHILVGSGGDRDRYVPNRAYDGNLSTAWCVNAQSDGAEPFLYFTFSPKDDSLPRAGDYADKKMTLNFSIVNGLAASNVIYQNNNRIRSIRLHVFESWINFHQRRGAVVSRGPVLAAIYDFNLKDDIGAQNFPLRLRTVLDTDHENGASVVLMGKIEITGVFRGEKYDDTCVSEVTLEYTPVD
jgi:hypothetical protein